MPGARLMPMGRLPQHLAELPRGQRIYLVCASGNRSLAAADLLDRAGMDAMSVAGGTGARQRTGKPVTPFGTRPKPVIFGTRP